jgi:hypothetical protein
MNSNTSAQADSETAPSRCRSQPRSDRLNAGAIGCADGIAIARTAIASQGQEWLQSFFNIGVA